MFNFLRVLGLQAKENPRSLRGVRGGAQAAVARSCRLGRFFEVRPFGKSRLFGNVREVDGRHVFNIDTLVVSASASLASV